MTTAPDADANRSDRSTMVLTFSLEGTRYCVEVERVVAAVGVDEYDVLEGAADPWNAGELTLDGAQVRVVDLARAFGSTRSPDRVDDPHLLVFESTDEGRRCGWLVDDVDVAQPVDPSTLERSSGHVRFVRGWVELDGERLVWLNEAAING